MTASSTISEGSTILISGATGFIGAHCVGQLLQKNFKVKALSRSLEKYEMLKAEVPDTKRHLLTCVLLSDILKYDDLLIAVKDCDGILHLASPFTYSVTDFRKQLMEPAVIGTTNILKAALLEPKIKKVVITSSFAAVYDSSKGEQPNTVLTEKDFSPLTWEDGISTKDPKVAYRASKIVAERAAWDFLKRENPNFSISVLCPTMVFGPLYSIRLLKSVSELNFSNTIIWKVLNSSSSEDLIPPTRGPVWVDVRDLALAHVRALVEPIAANQRYLVSAGNYDNQEIADILREASDYANLCHIPIGNPGERLASTHFATDSSKATQELGIQFRPLKDSVIDISKQLYQFIENEIK
ncbi:uncharacterized protein PRCAT00001397001 [Priceomyces carsonii]|uniref:uncharacterized protein n=1 Tax=Priceomyces carsonii TaxID=28549 RepID=UPI002ED7E9EB|nr:unnamed protein product [Priceomyces carsonii]